MHKCKRLDFICKEKGSGSLWLIKGGEELRIDYCPFCGYEAKVKLEDVEKTVEVYNSMEAK